MATLKENVAKMVESGVPEEEIAEYIKTFGANSSSEPEPDYWRGVAETTGTVLGGIASGALSAIDPIPGDEIPAVLGGMALGGSMGGQAYDMAKQYFDPDPKPTSVASQTRRAANDVGLGLAVPAVSAPILRGIGNVAKSTISPIKSTLRRGVGNVGADTLPHIKRVEAAGFHPEIGMFNNPEAQTLSQSLRTGPFSGRLMASVDRENIEQGIKLSDDIARSLGIPLAPEEAGAVVRHEAAKAQGRFFKGADVLYKKLEKFVPEQVEANNIRSVVDNIRAQAGQSQIAGKYLKDVVDLAELASQDIADGTINKSAIQQIKKMAKGAYKKNPALRTDSDRFVMQLERAADSDLQDAAIKYGGAKAKNAVDAAKSWWKMGQGNVKRGDVGLLDDTAHILKQAEDGSIYNWLTREGKNGANRLQRVLNFMDEDSASAIRATAFKELGKPSPGMLGPDGGGFSFSSFLTNYNKISDSAKKALFGKAPKQMDDLLEVSSYMKALERRANTSNTDNIRVWREMLSPLVQGFTFGGIGGLTGGSTLTGALTGGALGATAKGAQLAVNNRAAKLISDPQFVKWLADTGKKVMISPTSIGPQMSKIAAMGMLNPDKADAYLSYVEAMGYDTKKTTSSKGKLKSIEVK